MRWETVQGRWPAYRTRLREAFKEMTSEDVHALPADRNEILGLLEEKYGVDRADADRRFEDWLYGLRDELGGRAAIPRASQ
jgi:hypothetical protein